MATLRGATGVDQPAPEEATVDAPTALMAGLLTALVLGFLYPGAAFPSQRILVSVALLGCAVAAAFLLARSGRGLLPFRQTATRVALAGALLLPCWLALRLGGAPVPALGRETVALAAVFALSFFVAAASASLAERSPSARARDPLQLLLLVIGGVLAALAAFSLYQVYGTAAMPRSYAWLEAALLAELSPDDPQREGLLHAVRERRAAGTFGAPNIFASFCVAGAMLCAAASGLSRGLLQRAAFALATVAIGLATMLSGSRGGLLALVAAGALLATLAGSMMLSPHSRRRLFVALGIAAVLATITAVVVVASLGEDSRWGNISGLKQRVFYWRSGMAIWAESPVLGPGPGSFAALYPQHRIAGANETIRPHSTIVHFATSGGIVALLLFLVAVGGALWSGLGAVLRAKEEGDHARALAACGIAAAAVGMLLHSLIEYTMEFREANLLLGALLGVLAGLGGSGARDVAPSPRDPRALAVTLVPALVAMAVLWRCEFRPLTAAAVKEQVINLNTHFGSNDIPIRKMDRAFRNAPDAPDLFDLRAWFHEGRGNFAAAEADLRHAIALNPYSARLRERLALLLQTMGRRDEALAMQREAIALHPLDPEHWMTLAEMLAGGGRLDEARAALRETFGLLLISESEQQRRRRIAAALSVELPAEESR